MFRKELAPYRINLTRSQIDVNSLQYKGCSFFFRSKSYIAFNSDGNYFAVLNNCPHQNKPLDHARCENNKIICPFHNFAFDIETGIANGLALEKFELKVLDEEVFILLPKIKWF